MKKVLYFLLAALLVLGTVILFKTFTFQSKQINVDPVNDIAISKNCIRTLAKAITFKTISFEDSTKFDSTAFKEFHDFIKSSFPLVHTKLKLEKINQYSLLFTWEGKNKNLKPVLLMSHQDVVPVENNDWKYPAFEGKISEGYLWGRGTLDDKTGIFGIMEATEKLLIENFQPEHTIYFAFGHDEEIGGKKGNKEIAALLKSRNIELEFVLDEGGTIISNVVQGISSPIALIGIAEKGYLSLELTSKDIGGHSSMPPPHTAIGTLSTAIDKLEKNPFPSEIKGATGLMFDYMAPEMSFGKKLIFANRWLFDPIIKSQLAKSNSTSASLHTTTAATVFHSGTKDNILPTSARAIVNFRIIPGESRSTVMNEVRRIIDNPKVEIKALEFGGDPSPVSDINNKSFESIHKTIKQIFPDIIVAPYLVQGATDSRHYTSVSKNIYRFIPIQLNKDDLPRIHGIDERVGIENYYNIIRFYYQFIKYN